VENKESGFAVVTFQSPTTNTMPNFTYTARDERGQSQSGMITADNATQVMQQLRAEGKYPVAIERSDAVTQAPVESRVGGGMKVSRAEVIQFSTQLSIMIETGVTLSEALECIASQSINPRMRDLVKDLADQVQGGTDFSAALAKHPRIFPRLYVSLIRASEKSGMMSKLLNRATVYLRDEQEILRKVRGALTYPGIMLGFAITTTIFLLIFVLPRFTSIYANKGAALPAPTQILMSASKFVTEQYIGIIATLLITTIGAWFYFRTAQGKRVWDFISLNIPLVGPVLMKLHLARGMRMIGTMSAAGVSLVDCVDTAHGLCGNTRFRDLWIDVSRKLQTGKQMSDALMDSRLVPRSVAQMIHSGEKSGKLSHVLEAISGFSETELKEKISDLTRYIEPAMILIMGLIIGGVALALMLPIFTISKVVAH